MTRIAPHLLDTVFLLSGVGLLFVLRLQYEPPLWLVVKLFALVVYIFLGAIGLRHGKTPGTRVTAGLLAVAVFVYIVGVAFTKSAASWFLPVSF